jgi:hypothetical protein
MLGGACCGTRRPNPETIGRLPPLLAEPLTLLIVARRGRWHLELPAQIGLDSVIAAIAANQSGVSAGCVPSNFGEWRHFR